MRDILFYFAYFACSFQNKIDLNARMATKRKKLFQDINYYYLMFIHHPKLTQFKLNENYYKEN